MSLNTLADLGAGLGLLMDLADLDRPRPVPVPRPARPAPAWRQAGAEDAQREAALRWIVSCAPRPLQHEHMHMRRMAWLSANAEPPDRSDGPDNQQWVRATAQALTLWQQNTNPAGITRIDEMSLFGLFEFMQRVAWPLWVTAWAGQRLVLEADLPTVTAAAVERHLRHEEAKRDAIGRSIAGLLAQRPRARALYASVLDEDVPSLRRYQWAWMRFRLGIEPQQLAEYLRLIGDGDVAKVAKHKSHLQYHILLQLLRDRMERGEYRWHHPDYDRLKGDDSAETARLSHAAEHYYATDFRQFCLQGELLELESTLFAGVRHERLRPYPELIEELAATRKPLSMDRQRAFKPADRGLL